MQLHQGMSQKYHLPDVTDLNKKTLMQLNPGLIQECHLSDVPHYNAGFSLFWFLNVS